MDAWLLALDLVLNPTVIMTIIGSALFGLFQGGIVPMYAIIVREFFPPQEAGVRLGIVLMATLMGMALGGWMSGVIFDLTASYRAAFVNGLLWNLVNALIVLWMLMRPGGRLVFLTNSFISYLCAPDEGGIGETLLRPQFGAYRMQWPGENGIEYHLPHGEWIDLLRASGFEIERLIELQAQADATQHEFYDYVTPEWARQWPAEEIWVARLGR